MPSGGQLTRLKPCLRPLPHRRAVTVGDVPEPADPQLLGGQHPRVDDDSIDPIEPAECARSASRRRTGRPDPARACPRTSRAFRPALGTVTPAAVAAAAITGQHATARGRDLRLSTARATVPRDRRAWRGRGAGGLTSRQSAREAFGFLGLPRPRGGDPLTDLARWRPNSTATAAGDCVSVYTVAATDERCRPGRAEPGLEHGADRAGNRRRRRPPTIRRASLATSPPGRRRPRNPIPLAAAAIALPASTTPSGGKSVGPSPRCSPPAATRFSASATIPQSCCSIGASSSASTMIRDQRCRAGLAWNLSSVTREGTLHPKPIHRFQALLPRIATRFLPHQVGAALAQPQ